jgi:hypothetical protein
MPSKNIFSNKNYGLKFTICALIISCLCIYSVYKGKSKEVFIEDCFKNPCAFDNQEITLLGGYIVESHKDYIYYKYNQHIFKINGISLPASEDSIDITVIFKKNLSLQYQNSRKSYKFKPVYKDAISLLALFITVYLFFRKYRIVPSKVGLFLRRKE